MYPYKEAILKKYNRKGKTEYWIEFSAWCIPLNKMYRKRVYGFSKSKDEKQIEKDAKEYMLHINKLLKQGNVFTSPPKLQKKTDTNKFLRPVKETAIECLAWYLNKKAANCAKNTVVTYRIPIVHFGQFLEEERIPTLIASAITPDMIERFAHWVQVKNDLENRTLNNYIIRLRTAFNTLIKAGYMEHNPAVDWAKLPEHSIRNTPFTDRETQHLKAVISKRDPYLWKFIHLLFYGFMRIEESRLLKVKDVDLKRNRILSRDESSKTKDRYIKITTPLRKMLEEHIPPDSNPTYYVFGKKGEPSPNPVGPKLFSRRHQKILKSLNYDTRRHVLYSWKPTGIIHHIESGFDILWIQKQIGHTSINTTNQYLKKIGHDYHITSDLDVPEI